MEVKTPEVKAQPEVKKEPRYKPVYIRIGRGEDTEALTLDAKMVEIMSNALRKTTNEGDMYTAAVPERSKEGHRQAEIIWKFLKLLKEKAD